MASMRDIKRRKESITSTSQITKAMKLVATVKLQKAKSRAEQSKPYFNLMYGTVSSILKNSPMIEHVCLQSRKKDESEIKKGVILISSNRGLAGGYNSNVVKLITKGDFTKENTTVYPIGRKGKDAIARQGYFYREDFSEIMNNPLFSDAVEISGIVYKAFIEEEIDEIYIAYTNFKNTVKHVPTLVKLLPIEIDALEEEEQEEMMAPMSYEPNAEEALDYIIPLYLNSIIYGALVEAVASENGARMQAMDSATNNAGEMIDKLELQYNRARQSSITQELTEIVAGASAIE